MRFLAALVFVLLLSGHESSYSATPRGAAEKNQKPTAAAKKQSHQERSAPASTSIAASPVEGSAALFLPDSALLARVNDRRISVYNFRERYFAATSEDRPAGDSLGRLEFLNTLIDKEVLGLTALNSNRPLGYEDRVAFESHVNVTLENILYTVMVTDSIFVDPSEIDRYRPQFGYEQRLRTILFADRQTAERVRRDLRGGRITWSDAARRYQRGWTAGNPDGDLGWVSRAKSGGEFALRSFELQPNAISAVLFDVDGYRLVQCLDRRKVTPHGREFTGTLIRRDLREDQSVPLVHRMYEKVRALARIEYDSTNIRWVADRFKQERDNQPAHSPGVVDLAGVLPSFGPQDTARVLARTPTRRITLGQFLEQYMMIPVLSRSEIVTLERFIIAFDGPALRPERVALARTLGLDKDPRAVEKIEKRREELLVEYIYQDSVTRHVSVTGDMRLKHFKDREKEFVSIPRVKYVRFVAASLSDAESLLARLRSGEKAEDIIRVNQERGDDSSAAVIEVTDKDAREYRKILFEELRPGQSTKLGPDKSGQFLVFQVLSHEASRQLKFGEVERLVDEWVQNLESERLLEELLARLRTRYDVRVHPERVMQIRFTDPLNDPQTAAKP